MTAICIYFQAHQPNRLKEYSFFEIGKNHFYENDDLNLEVLNKVSEKCYLPANEMLLRLLERNAGKLKLTYSISGVLLEQLENLRPDVLESFKKLVDTGHVEILCETYYHSLAYNFSKTEFEEQVEKHKATLKRLFGVVPTSFRNTELIYNNEIASYLEGMGFKTVLAEGVDKLLGYQSPNYLYKAPNTKKIVTLVRNCKLSDDVAFRFSDRGWKEYPLTAEKFNNWIEQSGGDIANIFIDYETIGEHHWSDTGIFDFWSAFLQQAVDRGFTFITPSAANETLETKGNYDVHEFTSWADSEKDLTAWVANSMEFEAITKIYKIRDAVRSSSSKGLIHVWRKLQTSDHFYYMSTKGASDGAVHNYFSPYNTPYDAYIYFMNILSDIEVELEKENIDVQSLLRKPENEVIMLK